MKSVRDVGKDSPRLLQLERDAPSVRALPWAATRELDAVLPPAPGASGGHAGAPARGRRWSVVHMLGAPAFGWTRLVSDVLMLALACALALAGAPRAGVSLSHSAVLLLYPPLVLAALYARGMYRRRLTFSILDGIGPLIGAISLAAMVLIAGHLLLSGHQEPYRLIARAWIFTALYLGGARVVLVLLQRSARRGGLLGKGALIIGAGSVGAHVVRRLQAHPEYGLRPVGFLDAAGQAADHPEGSLPLLGTPAELAAHAASTGADNVILAFSTISDRGLVPIVRECEQLGLAVWLVPRLFEAINDRVALDHIGGLPLLGLRATDPQGWMFTLKHGWDRLLAALALLAGAPLLLGIALAVRMSSPGPLLFRQRRVGRDGQVFDLLKFRSMHLSPQQGEFRPADGNAPGGVEGDDRRTRIGCWLRRSSLDELPQLVNVVRGEMSLVGPRPERPEFVELFGQGIDRYADRHRVKSGITGWAQVNGLRGQTSVADRVEWDNYYIENWSLKLDLKILVLTILAVLRPSE